MGDNLSIYHYTAIDKSGEKLNGQIEAMSRDVAMGRLTELGLLPIDVKETSGTVVKRDFGFRLGSSAPTPTQITLFTHELSMLLKAGIPLADCLDMLARDASSKKLKELISRLRREIDQGKSLAEAMSLQNGAFPEIYVNMVRVAELSGGLEPVLKRIAEGREKAEKLRSKAISATIYPIFLIIMAIFAIGIMLIVVVPRFKQMLEQTGRETPASAQFVINASDWLINNHISLLIGIGVGALLLAFLWQQNSIRQKIEMMLLHLPIVGHLMKVNLTIRFCRTLGALLENGVDLPAALKLVKDIIGHKKAETAIEEASVNLRKGRSFIEPLRGSSLFPATVTNMLKVGEETSGLEQSLQHLADLYEDKLERDLQRTFTILEPVIILCVSGLIAGIIISVLSAVLSINELAL